jgi:hypothetical protein
MRKILKSISRKSSTDSDESTIVNVVIIEAEEGIIFSIIRQDAILKTRKKARDTSEETLSLEEITVEQLVRIYEVLDDWLESESKSTFFEDLPGIQGGYEKEEKSHGYSSTPSKTNTTFDGLRLSVGEFSIGFEFDSDGETKGIQIPSAEEVGHGIPQDFRNVYQLTQAIFDFFTYRYSGDVAGFEISKPNSGEQDAVERVERVFKRFDSVVRQLRTRGRDRPPFTVSDEYDLQYLLHAILRLDFDDIRDETYLKQHGGVSPRIDLLIEEEKIGIETKFASPDNSVRKIRNQLAEDKEHYKSDSGCNTLLCFIYDPGGVLTNPAEMEKDLSEVNDNLITRVTVNQ